MTTRIETYGNAGLVAWLKGLMKPRIGYVPYGFRVTKRFIRENQALFR